MHDFSCNDQIIAWLLGYARNHVGLDWTPPKRLGPIHPRKKKRVWFVGLPVSPTRLG